MVRSLFAPLRPHPRSLPTVATPPFTPPNSPSRQVTPGTVPRVEVGQIVRKRYGNLNSFKVEMHKEKHDEIHNQLMSYFARLSNVISSVDMRHVIRQLIDLEHVKQEMSENPVGVGLIHPKLLASGYTLVEGNCFNGTGALKFPSNDYLVRGTWVDGKPLKIDLHDLEDGNKVVYTGSMMVKTDRRSGEAHLKKDGFGQFFDRPNSSFENKVVSIKDNTPQKIWKGESDINAFVADPFWKERSRPCTPGPLESIKEESVQEVERATTETSNPSKVSTIVIDDDETTDDDSDDEYDELLQPPPKSTPWKETKEKPDSPVVYMPTQPLDYY